MKTLGAELRIWISVWVFAALLAVPCLHGQALGLGSDDRDSQEAPATSLLFVDPWVVVTVGRSTVEFPVAGGTHALYRISSTASNVRTADITFTLPPRDGPSPRVVEVSFPNGGKIVTDEGDANWAMLTLDGANTGRLRIRAPLFRGVFTVRILETPEIGMDLKFRVGTPGEPLQPGEAGSLVPYAANSRWE